jgi:hypothetical protein
VAKGQQGGAGYKADVGLIGVGIGHRSGVKAKLAQQVVVAEVKGGAGEGGRLHDIPVLRTKGFERRHEGEGEQRVRRCGAGLIGAGGLHQIEALNRRTLAGPRTAPDLGAAAGQISMLD